MICPSCGIAEDNYVLDTRHLRCRNVIRRRRQCYNCKTRFTTHEVIVDKELTTTFKGKRGKYASYRY